MNKKPQAFFFLIGMQTNKCFKLLFIIIQKVIFQTIYAESFSII